MFALAMAGITVCVQNRFSYVERLCADYAVPMPEKPDLTVCCSEEEIRHEMSLAESPVTPGYAEGVCVYRSICKRLPAYCGAFLFHSAVISYRGNGYAFAAKSGTGKSTHITLWQKVFGEEVTVVNGDKPIFRFDEKSGDLLAYGTPWCGKECLGENTSVPLRGLCFLERGKENRIEKLSPADAVTFLFSQILTPEDTETLDALFPLLDRMLATVPCYRLACNMEDEAALVSFAGMDPNHNGRAEREKI